MTQKNAAMAVLGALVLAAGIVVSVSLLVSTKDQGTDLTRTVGQPVSVPWPSTTSHSVTTVEIVVARITLADDPALGNGRKVANVRIFFRNVSSESVDVRGYLTTIGVYTDDGARANLVREDLGRCSPNTGSTVLRANGADVPYLDCALYRLPRRARGVGRVVFTENVGGKRTTVTWTPAR